MSEHKVEKIYVFKRYERFWHWSQAAMIIFMMITGFEIAGYYSNMGFQRAVELHTLTAWALITLWAFTIFWQFTTGEWKQYLPTLRKIDAIAKYYAWDIFKGLPHPYKKTTLQKHNPLQRLAYLALLALVSPIIWVSGLLYLFYAYWPQWGLEQWLKLEWVATAHLAGALMMLVFFIVHVYLTTTGHTVFGHIKAMITGWEDLHDDAPASGRKK